MDCVIVVDKVDEGLDIRQGHPFVPPEKVHCCLTNCWNSDDHLAAYYYQMKMTTYSALSPLVC